MATKMGQIVWVRSPTVVNLGDVEYDMQTEMFAWLAANNIRYTCGVDDMSDFNSSRVDTWHEFEFMNEEDATMFMLKWC